MTLSDIFIVVHTDIYNHKQQATQNCASDWVRVLQKKNAVMTRGEPQWNISA